MNPPKTWSKREELGKGSYGNVYLIQADDNPKQQLVVKLVEIDPNTDLKTKKVLCTFLPQ